MGDGFPMKFSWIIYLTLFFSCEMKHHVWDVVLLFCSRNWVNIGWCSTNLARRIRGGRKNPKSSWRAVHCPPFWTSFGHFFQLVISTHWGFFCSGKAFLTRKSVADPNSCYQCVKAEWTKGSAIHSANMDLWLKSLKTPKIYTCFRVISLCFQKPNLLNILGGFPY